MSESEIEKLTTHLSKTEKHFRKDGWGFAVEYNLHEGSMIDAIRFYKRAALLRAFGFNNTGELNKVYVEKRLLDKTPSNAEEGIEMFKQQSGGEIGSTTGKPPVYKIILRRQEDGKFAVLERSEITDQHAQWETEFNRDAFRTPPQVAENNTTLLQRLGDDLRRRSVGSAIKSYLIGKGVTQKSLAETTGIRPESLSRVLGGKGRPSAGLLLKLSNALNLSSEQTQQLLELTAGK